MRNTAASQARTAATSDRFAQRARHQRRRTLWRAAAVAVMVTMLGLAGWLVWFSPLLTVHSVRVDGVSGDQAAHIEQVAAVPQGLPLARVDTDAITSRVRTVVSIAEARTVRSWPRSVVITVRPRVPALVLRDSQGQLKVADSGGVVFAEPAEAPAGIPVVTTAGESGAEQQAVAAALSLVQALPSDLQAQVTTITVSGANLVTFSLGAVPVTWGGADQPTRKVQVLRALLKTNPAAIDVSAPDTPVTR